MTFPHRDLPCTDVIVSRRPLFLTCLPLFFQNIFNSIYQADLHLNLNSFVPFLSFGGQWRIIEEIRYTTPRYPSQSGVIISKPRRWFAAKKTTCGVGRGTCIARPWRQAKAWIQNDTFYMCQTGFYKKRLIAASCRGWGSNGATDERPSKGLGHVLIFPVRYLSNKHTIAAMAQYCWCKITEWLFCVYLLCRMVLCLFFIS